jgi:hypothetical protein
MLAFQATSAETAPRAWTLAGMDTFLGLTAPVDLRKNIKVSINAFLLVHFDTFLLFRTSFKVLIVFFI